MMALSRFKQCRRLSQNIDWRRLQGGATDARSAALIGGGEVQLPISIRRATSIFSLADDCGDNVDVNFRGNSGVAL